MAVIHDHVRELSQTYPHTRKHTGDERNTSSTSIQRRADDVWNGSLRGVNRRKVFSARRVCIARTMPWQDVCPSVRLSACLSACLSDTRRYWTIKRLYISSKCFPPSGSPTILVFPHQTGCQYSDENFPNRGVECKGVWKKFTTFDQHRALYRNWCKIEV